MSEKKARQKRAAQARQSPEPPVAQPLTVSVEDLLQLVGAKEAQILLFQRQIVGLQQQVRMLAEQLAEKSEKKG